ncbi:hypothetical protein P8605_44910 [Streptomyces sp. T-3]|nr:hypothetical protein [Streptomyces sp. T-3]
MNEREDHPYEQHSGEQLPEELRELGRRVQVPDIGGETMAERVIAQIVAASVPVPVAEPPGRFERLRALLRRHWRRLTAALCGVVTILVLTPPVRAAVADWFGWGGVEVRYDPDSPRPTGEPVPGCENPVSLAEAARRAGFTPVVPTELGAPDAVSVTEHPHRRSVVSLCWRADGTGQAAIRLDEFPADLDLSFGKLVRVQPEWPRVGDATGVWFAEPHRLTFWMTDKHGKRWEQVERTAGPTLLWSSGAGITARLEGEESMRRAVQIAESVEQAETSG